MLIDDLIRASRPSNMLHYVIRGLIAAHRYEITNVLDYFRIMEPKAGELVSDTFPNIAPLGVIDWYEWVERVDGRSLRCGLLFTVMFDTKNPDETLRQYGLNYQSFMGKYPESRWLVETEFYHADSHGWSPGKVNLWLVIDGAGKMITMVPIVAPTVQELERNNQLINAGRGSEVSAGKRADTNDTYTRSMIVMLYPALMAICFAHCKGVEVSTVQPSRQVRRQLERDGKPVIAHHVINIDPVRRILKNEGDVEHTGMRKALHVCRAHFATYTADKPLFGHYVGTVYIPQHIRGSRDRGVVTSEHVVYGSRK